MTTGATKGRTTSVRYREGDRCSRHHADPRVNGCVGRLVIVRTRRIGEGRYLPDPNGERLALVCDRCEQAHGRVER